MSSYTVQKIAKNTGVLITGDVIFRFISLFVTIYLARYLGTADFGKYGFIFAFIAFSGVVTDSGLRTILVRGMSREPLRSPKLIGNGYFIKAFLTILAVALSTLTITLMDYPTDITHYVYIASLTLVFFSFSDLYEGIFQANLSMVYSVIAKLSFKLISAALIFWIIFSHGTLVQILWALVVAEAIKTFINYYYSRRFVKPKLEIDIGLCKHLLKESLPIALSSVTLVIYFNTDVVMLSIIQGDSAVGIYYAAHKLVEPLNFIPYALVLSLFPIMSEFFKSSREKLTTMYQLGFKYILVIMLPLVVCVAVLSDEIIFMLYGGQFTASVQVLGILIWVLMFSSLSMLIGNFLISIEKQTLHMYSMLIGTLVNVVFNFLLIPVFSYTGAAIVTLATNIVIFAVNMYFVSNSVGYMNVRPKVLKPLVCGLVMGITMISFKYFDITVFLSLPFGIIMYFAGLHILEVFTGVDIQLFKKIIAVSRR
ncbi:MAG: flippase [Euryarchaeota archaeon]|nr:flippase [Euryarchaeota archaeon]